MTAGQVQALTVSASSGLPVSLSTSGPCAIDEARRIVTATGAGTCTITAGQGGNATWHYALPVFTYRTFTITAAPAYEYVKTGYGTVTCPSGFKYVANSGFVDAFSYLESEVSANGLVKYVRTVLTSGPTTNGYRATGQVTTLTRFSTSVSFIGSGSTASWNPPVNIICLG
jgi:hypothetical protein